METHVKYESPSSFQSKVITKVKVLRTDGQTDNDYYRAPVISEALKKNTLEIGSLEKKKNNLETGPEKKKNTVYLEKPTLEIGSPGKKNILEIAPNLK
jgi:hypothetical protein